MNWPDLDDVQAVSPALAAYNHAALAEVWHRPQMSVRDRSLITVAALIARMQTLALPFHFGWALDHGVAPAELSEIITHLAFYSGWPHAEAAITAAKELFRRRGIAQEHLPPAKPLLLPLNEVAEQRRAAQVASNFGAVTPGLVENTTEVLFRDLWLRPALAPRDRSLVTVSSLIAAGQVAQIPYHLGRAMDNGLTPTEAGEIVAHLAFYAGWPNAFSAAAVVKEVIVQRAHAD